MSRQWGQRPAGSRACPRVPDPWRVPSVPGGAQRASFPRSAAGTSIGPPVRPGHVTTPPDPPSHNGQGTQAPVTESAHLPGISVSALSAERRFRAGGDRGESETGGVNIVLYACQRLVLYRPAAAEGAGPRARPTVPELQEGAAQGRASCMFDAERAIACLCCRPVMRWPVAWFTGDQRPWCGRAGCGRSRRSSGTPCAGGSRRWTGSGTAARRCPGCSRPG